MRAGCVLLLTPSRGLGGGIERYVETLEWAFTEEGVDYHRIDLSRSGALAHGRMFAQARSQMYQNPIPTRLVLAHQTLLPAAMLLARDQHACGISVICHGSEVWRASPRVRHFMQKRMMRNPSVRVVAVSSFTAGALAAACTATTLPPGLCQGWFDMLVEAANGARSRPDGLHLVTAFRLADWRSKGLLELLAAVAALGKPDIHVTVCGTGAVPSDLVQVVQTHRGCILRPELSDRALAQQFADADLFVLATRTRSGHDASGEGFGLVLLEAQIAGTPVVGPAFGGSHDAYIGGFTGVAPADETADSLARTLDELIRDPCRLKGMGERASEWARESFAPERYAPLAVARLV